MIIAEVFYGVKCDRCDEMFKDDDHSFYNDESSVIENSTESGWTELNGKHYCPDCYEIDEETDEVKVLEEYPQQLKTLNGFIDKIVKGVSRGVFETEDSFLITCQLYFKPQLEPFEVGYIKSLLDNKFISLDYEKLKYNRVVCHIKMKK